MPLKFTHIQSRKGETRKVVDVNDDYITLADDKGKLSKITRDNFRKYHSTGEFKVGNVGDKDDFVEYKVPTSSIAEKMTKLFFAPYTTMAKKTSGRTVVQDVLGTLGGHFGGHIINYGIDNLMPSDNSKMETSLGDALLGTALGFPGYKMIPKAAHRKIPFLDKARGDLDLKKEIATNLRKDEAYQATHPKTPISTQEEQYTHNRDVANNIYKRTPVFNRKVPTPLDKEFRWNTDKKLINESVEESNALRGSLNNSDKTKVINQKYDGSQQGGGTEHTHTEIRGQKPSDGNLDDLQLEIQEILDGNEKVADNGLNLQKTIDTDKKINKGSQNSGTNNTNVKEHGTSSTDVNTDKSTTRKTYDYTPTLEDAEEHTAINTREDLRDLFKSNSYEAKRIKKAETLNELSDIVKDIRRKDANNVNVDKWEQAMKERIIALVDKAGEAAQAELQRFEKLKTLDKIKFGGDPAKPKSNIFFDRIPRGGGTAYDYIKSYGESYYPGIRYPVGLGLLAGKQTIPVLRNKDDETFNEGEPSGDEVFEELRKSMKKKPSLNYVDPNKRETK